MVVLSKGPDGTVDRDEHPPGYQQVGDERYGQWRDDGGGRSFWEFYGQYALLSNLIGGFGRPIYRDDWDGYRDARGRGQTYYGPGAACTAPTGRPPARPAPTSSAGSRRARPRRAGRSASGCAAAWRAASAVSASSRQASGGCEMSVDQIVAGFVYLAVILVLLAVGKWVYDALHRRFVLRVELLEKDNLALAVTVAGYYLGLVIVLGGVVSGPASVSLVDDVIGLVIFGALAIVLLNLSAWVNDRLVFSRFDNEREIVEDRNVGVGILEGANYVAVGLIAAGALSGEGGMASALVFWVTGLAALVVAGVLYDRITAYDLHDQIEGGNVAVAVAFAGVLVGFGNVIRLAGEGDFVSWNESLTEFGYYLVVGLVLLPLVRLFADKVLLPGARLADELVQERPNLGAGVIEGVTYLAASMLIGLTL